MATLLPADAMRMLIERTFDYDDANPDFIRLVSIENIHRGKHMAKSQDIAALNRPVIDNLRCIPYQGAGGRNIPDRCGRRRPAYPD